MHHNRGYGTRNVEVDTLPIFITGRAKQLYNLKVRSIEGKWEVLRETFCRTFFSLAWISDLRCVIILFKQKEGESLGTS
jgi:hypothetical protein